MTFKFNKNIFKDKKITIMGLGLLGRGINDAKFLAKCGANLTVTDLKNEKQLEKALLQLKGLEIEYILGKHRLQDFKDKDFILKGAGVPKNSKYLKVAKDHKVPIEMDDALFAKHSPCPIIGVTGTRGKTTTTYLIYELLKNNFKDKKVFIGGNIPGIATLPFIEKVKEDSYVVLELSSWQLQGWHDGKISPHISVITNIYPDHLNYYRSMRDYVYDKKAIYRYQTEEDYLILNKDNPASKEFAKEAKSKIIWFSKNEIPASWKLKILGDHNRENAAAAIKVAEILRVDKQNIKKSIENFKALPNRLELVRNLKGVSYYNDNNSTTPEATMAALHSFPSKDIILIAGGSDKKLVFKEMARKIKQKTKAVIIFEGSAQEKLHKELKKINCHSVFFVDSMKEAVKQAKLTAKSGDVVLLSPGCASFGLFLNEYDRGDQYIKAVKNLK